MNKMKMPFSGCGIVGAFAFGGEDRENYVKRIDFKAMVKAMHHRGPEAHGIWEHEGIRFGHTRLSILDLSERGNQPMTRDHMTITLNGEIYNFHEIRKELEAEGFSFTSGTDTEVVLRAYQKWGPDALHKFNGMFAFAVWDDKKKTLFVARDRMGIKPLYFYKDDKILLFGSEILALMHSKYIPADINWDTLHQQMLIRTFFQYDLDTSLVKGVHSLPLGHFMIVKPDGQFKVTKYWDLPDTEDKHDASEEQLAEELKALMETSVKYRLVSDVPVASFLSGGLDSSMISVLASRLVKDYKLTVITVKYEGGGKDFYSGKADEDLKYSRIVADTIKDKIIHKVITVKPTDITVEALDNISDLAILNDDERFLPIHGNYRVVRNEGFKVVLNGEGADEIMGGYVGLNTVYNGIHDIHRPEEDIIRSGFPHLVLSDPKLFNDELMGHVDGIYEKLHHHFRSFGGDYLEKTHRYFAKGILQRILRLEDHVSMDSSVECRVPFLDHNVVEWSFRVPFQKHIRAADRMGKMLLRGSTKGFFPDEVIIRPKQAFPAPNKEGTEKVLRQIYKDHHDEIVNSDVIRRLYKKDFLASMEPEASYRDLWVLLIVWRWENRLKQFAR